MARVTGGSRRMWATGLTGVLLGGLVAHSGCGEERRGTPELVTFVTPKRDPAFVPKEAWDGPSGVGVVQPAREWELSGWEGGWATLALPVEGCSGWVELGGAAEGDPRAEGERRLAGWCGGEGGCRVSEENFVLYNGKTGWRWEGSRTLPGGATEMARTTVVVNPAPGGGGWRAVVEARGVARDYAARRRCLDVITAAVGLGEAGSAAPPLPSPAPGAVEGPSGPGEGQAPMDDARP